MRFEFDADVFRWDARTQDWFFAGIPPEISAEIREVPRMRRGFGSVRVQARIGDTVVRTSIFPDSDRGAYVLPLKRALREKEGVNEGDVIAVVLETLDG